MSTVNFCVRDPAVQIILNPVSSGNEVDYPLVLERFFDAIRQSNDSIGTRSLKGKKVFELLKKCNSFDVIITLHLLFRRMYGLPIPTQNNKIGFNMDPKKEMEEVQSSEQSDKINRISNFSKSIIQGSRNPTPSEKMSMARLLGHEHLFLQFATEYELSDELNQYFKHLLNTDKDFKTFADVMEHKSCKDLPSLRNLIFKIISRRNKIDQIAHFAAKDGKLEVLKFLQERGINLGAIDHNDDTPANYAAEYGKTEVIKFLGKLAIQPDEGGWTALHTAAQHDQVDVVKVIHELGLDLDTSTNTGLTPAHIAVDWGAYEVMDYFKEMGVDFEVKNEDGETPLLYHIGKDIEDIDDISNYKDFGLNLHAVDHAGMTLAHYAASEGKIKILKTLKESGVDLEARDKQGRAPVHYVADCNIDKEIDELHGKNQVLQSYLNVLEFFLNNEVDLSARDSKNNTPLQYAVMKEQPLEMLEYFVKNTNREEYRTWYESKKRPRSSKTDIMAKVIFGPYLKKS